MVGKSAAVIFSKIQVAVVVFLSEHHSHHNSSAVDHERLDFHHRDRGRSRQDRGACQRLEARVCQKGGNKDSPKRFVKVAKGELTRILLSHCVLGKKRMGSGDYWGFMKMMGCCLLIQLCASGPSWLLFGVHGLVAGFWTFAHIAIKRGW